MMREGGEEERGRVEGLEIDYGGGSREEEKRMRRGVGGGELILIKCKPMHVLVF